MDDKDIYVSDADIDEAQKALKEAFPHKAEEATREAAEEMAKLAVRMDHDRQERFNRLMDFWVKLPLPKEVMASTVIDLFDAAGIGFKNGEFGERFDLWKQTRKAQ
jgi:hypothetical protein